MVGWVLVGIGILALAQELWRQPRNMAKAREKVAQGGDPSRFDAFLSSRRYKGLQWSGLALGAGMVVVGILVLSGAP
jgi:hypothetical protein